MPSIYETYRDYDSDLLEMIAEHWGIEQDVNWRKKPARQVANLTNNPQLFTEMITSLSPSSLEAFRSLTTQKGRIEREIFARAHGNMREMGAAMREKERPDQNPISDTELLFYRGLIGLAFFDAAGEAKEFFFIPDEFLMYSSSPSKAGRSSKFIPPGIVDSDKVKLRTQGKLLEMMALRLAILRGTIPESEYRTLVDPSFFAFMDALLVENGVITKGASLDAEKLKNILQGEELELLPSLFESWRESQTVNDLRMVPGLTFEGQWINDPLKPREAILTIFDQLPANAWFLLDDLIARLYESSPHFLRSGGEFERWFIKENGRNAFLKGFSSWPLVEGRLVRYLVEGPLSWFGLVRIGTIGEDEDRIVFSRRNEIDIPIAAHKPSSQAEKQAKAIIFKNGDIYLPKDPDREMLYQIARFCTWNGKNEKFFRFRISPTAMRRAESQKINALQIQGILKKYGQEPIPSNVFIALDRWKKAGVEIQIEDVVIVRFNSAETLDQIASSGLKKILMERLNATTISIARKDIHLLENMLAEAGYLADNLTQYNQ
jgi:hypothetical protein